MSREDEIRSLFAEAMAAAVVVRATVGGHWLKNAGVYRATAAFEDGRKLQFEHPEPEGAIGHVLRHLRQMESIELAQQKATASTTQASQASQPTGPRAEPRRRGYVRRANGVAVRRVAGYLAPESFDSLRAYCGDSCTIADVVGRAVAEFLERQTGRVGSEDGAQ